METHRLAFPGTLLLILAAFGSQCAASPSFLQHDSSFSIRSTESRTRLVLDRLVAPQCLALRGGSSTIPKEHRLFVSNLPASLKEDDLKKAFAQFGKLTECKVTTPFLLHLQMRAQMRRAGLLVPAGQNNCCAETRLLAANHDPLTAMLSQILIDMETGQSRRMGYVAFASAKSAMEAVEEMDEEVASLHFSLPSRCLPLCPAVHPHIAALRLHCCHHASLLLSPSTR
eukprot:2364357-Rhodomonas_salina.5